MEIAIEPFPAPEGWRWVFCTKRWHWRAKKYLYAKDYERKAWSILVRIKKK
jgi:hypothetical protein